MRKCFIAPRRSRCGYSYANRRVWYCSRKRSYVVGYGAQPGKLEQGYGWSSGLGDGPLCQRRGLGGDGGYWKSLPRRLSPISPLGEPKHQLSRHQNALRHQRPARELADAGTVFQLYLYVARLRQRESVSHKVELKNTTPFQPPPCQG